MTTKTHRQKNKTNERAVLSVHTKKTTSDRLERLAHSTQRTKSALTNEALELFLNHQEWVNSEIEKGLADIDAGRVIEQAEMLAWVKKLRKSNT